MPNITFIQPDGNKKTVTVSAGTTLMRAAKDHGVPGILGDCGGECACSTCHVYIDEAWFGKLAPARDNESIMFGFLEEPGATSRLSCQIRVTDAMDGLTVRVPATQLQA